MVGLDRTRTRESRRSAFTRRALPRACLGLVVVDPMGMVQPLLPSTVSSLPETVSVTWAVASDPSELISASASPTRPGLLPTPVTATVVALIEPFSQARH